MRHPWQIWSAYVAALLVVAAAVGAVTFRALAAERAEQEARAQGAIEENIRLALWRMDSLMVPFVAQESARSFEEYRPLLRNPALSGKGVKPASSPAGLPASPALLTNAPAEVAGYFDIDPAGKVSFLSVPAQVGVRPGKVEATTSSSIASDHPLKNALENALHARQLASELPAPPARETPAPELSNRALVLQQNEGSNLALNQENRYGAYQNTSDYQVRSQIARNSLNYQRVNNAGLPLNDTVRIGSMRTVVVANELLLARQAIVNGKLHVQGCWLDWNSIQRTLRESVADLAPDVKLSLVARGAEPEGGRLMASLPVRLEWNGGLPESAGLTTPGNLSRPLQLSLALSWVCLALVAVAAAVVLWQVLALSERRASFVSAVTHELRTPLTTFKMYAEMLAEGMVPDEVSRKRYLETLRGEADRLSHLVENVLAYARLERGGVGNRLREISVDALLELIVTRAAERAKQAGFEVTVELSDDLLNLRVLADPSAVEQIFFNLIDNAAKYAAIATDRRLHVTAELRERQVLLKVSDHGPGLSPAQRRRLFEPFHKSAVDAAGSSPGVGLGLALSRRLARDMGGDLQAEASTSSGAVFVIQLCRASNSDS